MLTKLFYLVLLANMLSIQFPAFALTCAKDNKMPMNKSSEICCCKQVASKTYTCKPMTNKGDKKCPGLQVTEDDKTFNFKISTKESDSCTCGFNISE
ncbi:MAG: hypothetical protein A3B68_02485 [Candidatus Melainabacteria bacterium RIFCSPHIGHO2_02_FULL_34_12]|nr:MAG: hypothetical protein A3B68_02485 [Candidatus Melainabacteria bacterium RIFCSPHIGHO2_02_FULL_34_12]